MNKFLLGCLAALAVLSITVRWAEASIYDDFVAFPSLKAKRDLEMEEFFKDGNKHQARRRAVNRQRRANEEANAEFLARHRATRSLMEAEDDSDDVGCSAMERESMKRSAGRVRRAPTPDHPIKYKYIDSSCSDSTKQRIKTEMSTSYNAETVCQFAVEPASSGSTDHDVEVTCIPGSNWASIGMGTNGQKARMNLNQPRGAAYTRTIIHELGHLCGLIHDHQRCDRDEWTVVVKDCIQAGKEGQFDKEDTDGTCDDKMSNPLDFLQYVPTSFLDSSKTQANGQPCEVTIESRYPNGLSEDVFASQKRPYIADIALLNHNANKKCPENTEDLYNNEVIMAKIVNGEWVCQIWEYSPYKYDTDVQPRQLQPSEEPQVVQVYGKQAREVQCRGNVFELIRFEWMNLSPNARCAGEKGRLVFTIQGVVQTLANVCTSAWKAEVYGKGLQPEGQVSVDASQTSTGTLWGHFWCKN